jgi:hypothetical protein
VSRGLVYIRGDDGREELYDLRNDPLEANDLAGSPQALEIIGRFREELSRLGHDPRIVARTPHQGASSGSVR